MIKVFKQTNYGGDKVSKPYNSHFCDAPKETIVLNSPGPKTAAGKFKVSLNSLKHGLRTDKLLICKSNCFYKEICYMHETIYNFDTLESPGVCPLEAALYLSNMQRFSSDSSCHHIPNDLLEAYTMNEILLRRSSSYLALYPEASWASDYHLRLQNRSIKFLKEIKEIRPEAILIGGNNNESKSEYTTTCNT